MLNEAKKKSAKGKSKQSKPKVQSSVQDTIDPDTGQEIEVTKPAKAMTGNPANQIIVYPNTGGLASPVDPRNPMRNSQIALLQSHTTFKGRLLREYIDYARGVIVKAGGDAGIPVPAYGGNGRPPIRQNGEGDLGTDKKIEPVARDAAEADEGPENTAKFGDVNQRLRRRAGKRNVYNDPTGVWGGDDIDYAHTTHEDEMFIEGFKYPKPPTHIVPDGSEYVTATTKASADRVRARIAKTDGVVTTAGHGDLKHKVGDMIITHPSGDMWTVRGDIFKATYKRNLDGTYSKKAGLKLHGYIAQKDHLVKSIENPDGQLAKAGDLVLRGPMDEWYPQPGGEKAAKKYDIKPNRAKS